MYETHKKGKMVKKNENDRAQANCITCKTGNPPMMKLKKSQVGSSTVGGRWANKDSLGS